MYYDHFGLRQAPFRITPDTEVFYSGGNRGPILEALIYAISQGEGIIKVTGEVGSGKTMLCSMLQARLPPSVETIYIANPSVSPREILHAIALELHLAPKPDGSHLELMHQIHRHLLERHAQRAQVVMFVEEAQSMPIATLEEIRLLSNLETARSKLLQIVLFGQPELDDNLRQPNIRQLRERITHSFRLSPLNGDEIRDYLGFRLRAAGYHGPDLFSRSVVRPIAQASAGLTRRVNLIADKALLAAFSENTHTIKARHIRAAIRDSEFSRYESPGRPWSDWRRWALGVAGALAVIALFVLLAPYWPQESTRGATSGLAPVAPPVSSPLPSTSASPSTPPETVAPPESIPSSASMTTKIPDSNPPSEPPNTTAAAATEAPRRSQEAKENITKININEKVSASSQSLGIDAGLVDARFKATQEWLARQPATTYTIQLMGADNTQQLRKNLNNIRKYIEINDIFVYRTIAREKPSLTVLYGSYSDKRAAIDALSELPASLKAHKPLLRTVQGIRAEIAELPPS